MKRVGAIMHSSCSDGERLHFSPTEEDGCSHFVMKKSQDDRVRSRSDAPLHH